MTHSITVTSETRLTSTNGDGPQLLTEAATLYAALAALGAVPIVEIVIRTQPATPPEASPAKPSHSLRGFTAEEAAARVDTPNGPMKPWEVEPPAAPVDPTPPPQTVAGEWAHLSRDQRAEAVAAKGRQIAHVCGHVPTMAEWDAYKPQDWPMAGSLAKTYGDGKWTTVTASWAAASVAGA